VRKQSRIAILALALLSLTIAACGDSDSGGSSGSGEKQKIAWLWYGPKDDGGWNTTNHTPAQKALTDEFGDQIEQTDTDNIPYTAQLTQISEQAVQGGADLLVDTVAGGELFTKVCKKYPKVACLETNPPGPYPDISSTSPPNVAAIFPEFWNQEFILGYAAGLVTKSDTVGFIAPYEISLASSVQNSFLRGCQEANPKCQLRSVLINNYYDPPAEARAARTLIDAGADVVHGLVDTPSYCQAAEERGAWAVGQWRDYRESCPKAWLISPEWNFKDAYIKEVQLLVDGKWKGHRTTWLKFGEGADVAEPNEKAGKDVVAKISAMKEKVEGGYNPFVGPLYDNKGKLRVPEGQEMTKDQLYRKWNWKLRGTVGGK
jgi:basic membrane lipoprotein Med (substrate-binding protein (PBP1-ABC) superfamily)